MPPWNSSTVRFSAHLRPNMIRFSTITPRVVKHIPTPLLSFFSFAHCQIQLNIDIAVRAITVMAYFTTLDKQFHLTDEKKYKCPTRQVALQRFRFVATSRGGYLGYPEQYVDLSASTSTKYSFVSACFDSKVITEHEVFSSFQYPC